MRKSEDFFLKNKVTPDLLNSCESSPMRQILMNSAGVVVARVPRPAVEAGSVLVRVQYSLISVVTESPPLKAPLTATSDGASTVGKGAAYANLATDDLQAAGHHRQKAKRR